MAPSKSPVRSDDRMGDLSSPQKMPSESLRSDGIFVWVMYGRSRGCRLARRSGIGGKLLAERQELFELGNDAVLFGKRRKRNQDLVDFTDS